MSYFIEVAATRKILLMTDDAKKLARSPSPPRHKPTSVLYITHLVRPFTVQLLKNLLLRTGTIAENGFWIDKIKSKCYVEVSSFQFILRTQKIHHQALLTYHILLLSYSVATKLNICLKRMPIA